MIYTFSIQGSSEEPYTLQFSITEKSFKAECNCPAGLMGTLCKHIIWIIEGQIPSNLIDGDISKIVEISKAFHSSEVGDVYNHYKELEKEIEKLKKELKNRKKQVARLLYE
ncbi:SWIM zinc finger family protein [Ureibacillus thermosphaericus]|uniref:SWIM-type domain-containing protein n=1 Tax=Ureibacillus thermosphaericus TaxID=51173 RepID=A0A840PWQ9_URETH|nr:SWIM zinc finger family protein [Ureibacillus thermosphaericus]MBB5148618.1 hypothetical protein [Ureibacillus thermosphaericus]NKZ31335.1 hypothetical protein [Ureibacillus thermosphaericus]